MPRLSIKEQRAKEIINAFERCIAKNCITGAQLEKIADESGIQRPALRHFVGNRDQLILSLTKSIVSEYSQMFKSSGKLLDKISQGPNDLLIVLFMQAGLTTPERIIVFNNLYSIAPRYPKVRFELNKWYGEFIGWVAHRLAIYKPNAKKKELEKISAGLVSMSINFASLTPLALRDSEYDDIIEASSRLIDTL